MLSPTLKVSSILYNSLLNLTKPIEFSFNRLVKQKDKKKKKQRLYTYNTGDTYIPQYRDYICIIIMESTDSVEVSSTVQFMRVSWTVYHPRVICSKRTGKSKIWWCEGTLYFICLYSRVHTINFYYFRGSCLKVVRD